MNGKNFWLKGIEPKDRIVEYGFMRTIELDENYIMQFICGYVECALWSSTDNVDDSGGEPLDNNYDENDLDDVTFRQMQEDCLQFMRDNYKNLELFEEKYLNNYPYGACAGHDFWLTRNGHGAGFWDRGLGVLGEALSNACRYQALNLYVGDGGKIHGS